MKCLHCGDPTPSDKVSFCCSGCEAVYSLLLEIPNEDRALIQTKSRSRGSDFSYLDQPEFRDLYRHSNPDSSTEKYLFYIEGIFCASCVKLLESLSRIIPQVKSSELHFGDGTLEVYLYPHQAGLCAVSDIIERMGYQSHPILPGADPQEYIVKENRKDLMRIAVAGACSGNIMLLAISVYSGLSGTMGQAFNWLQFLLFLPVLLYSATPFYQGALRSLRYRNLGIDLPIVIALSLGVVFSIQSLFLQSDQIYFDSMAGFVLLILASRYLLKRIQQGSQKDVLLYEILQKASITVIENGLKKISPLKLLKKGDRILIPAGDRIPADGILISSLASIDLSILTGESLPKKITQGMEVFAGSRSYNQEIEVEVTQTGNDSRLGKMLSSVEQSQKKKTPLLNSADKASQYLIAIVLLIAGVFFIYKAQDDVRSAFERSLALIILACPCALALGAPLAISRGLRQATKMGIFIRSADSLEKLRQVQTVAFDKTGTLTYGNLKLNDADRVPPEYRSVLLSLESKSHHPIAYALRAEWPQVPSQDIQDWTETAGKGVSGRIENDFFELQRESTSRETLGPSVLLLKNNQPILTLDFTDQIRPESLPLLEKLRDKKLDTLLISGDRRQSVQSIAQQLKFSQKNIYSEMSPDQKKEILAKTNKAMMVGDGANDTLSMSESYLSVAVQGSVDEALKTADIYLSSENLNHIYTLFEIAQETQKVLVRNMSLALIYNFAAGIGALMGLIGPLGSAVLMPISSLIIIGSSYLGTRKLWRMNNEYSHSTHTSRTSFGRGIRGSVFVGN